MTEDPLPPGALQNLSKNWQIEEAFSDSAENILAAIEKKISELMTQSHEKFMHALYRLDVNEEKASAILSGRLLSNRGISKARALAELVLEREIQKAKTRAGF